MQSETKTQPEYELKHRLVGAVIMVSVAVVGIPWLLPSDANIAAPRLGISPVAEGESASPGIPWESATPASDTPSEWISPSGEPAAEPAADVALLAPAAAVQEDANRPKSALIAEPDAPVEVDAAVQSGEVAVSAAEALAAALAAEEEAMKKPVGSEENGSGETAEEETAAEESAEEAAAPAQTQATAPASESPPATPAPSGNWFVQVGIYGKPANANKVSTRLARNGFIARHTALQTENGKSTRVWIGPYEKLAAAVDDSGKMRSLFGEKGMVKECTDGVCGQ